MPPPLIDIAANLAAPAFASDLDAVVARAHGTGVTAMIAAGTTVADSAHSVALAQRFAGRVWCTVGVHPHHASTCDDDTIASLQDLTRSAGVVAIGECGLDFFRDLSPRPVQEKWFVAQMQLGAELRLPLYMHERDAHARCLALVREHRPQLVRAVIHCFTGDAAALRAYLDLDLHIGVTGWICDERRGLELQRLVRLVPAERLMLETDSPYLLPRTITPKPKSGRNEPAFLPWVLEMVAKCRGESAETVAARTTATARAFFGLGSGA